MGEGAQIYKKYLNRRTGWFSHARIAPVGNAFMSVFEESQYDIYPKLFMDDGIHPSAYGAYNNGNQYNGGYGNQYNGGYNNGNNNNNQNANDQYYNTDDAAQQQNGNGQYQQNYNYNNGN